MALPSRSLALFDSISACPSFPLLLFPSPTPFQLPLVTSILFRSHSFDFPCLLFTSLLPLFGNIPFLYCFGFLRITPLLILLIYFIFSSFVVYIYVCPLSTVFCFRFSVLILQLFGTSFNPFKHCLSYRLASFSLSCFTFVLRVSRLFYFHTLSIRFVLSIFFTGFSKITFNIITFLLCFRSISRYFFLTLTLLT